MTVESLLSTSFLSDDKGNNSSMRLVFWLITIVFCAIYSYCCIYAQGGPKLVPIPPEMTDIIKYIFIGKVGQKVLAESDLAKTIVGMLDKNKIAETNK